MSDGIVSIVARSLEYPVVRALVNVKDNAGRNPLSWAAERNYLDLARLLIYSDADIDSKSNVGRTPLSYAAGHDSKDVMELLLSHGAKAESTDREGRTPLSYAAGHDNKDVMELLLSHGAKVDPTDEEGRTPLSWWFSRIFDTQVRPSDQEVKTTVPLLLTDSNPLLQDEKYAIFLLWAAGTPDHNGGNASVKILDPFYFWGRAFGDVIHFWLEAENAWYKPTSEAESIIHRRDSSQRTLLHEAASSGHTFIAAKLLENGADIDAKDRHEATPLKVAIQMGNRGAVELLLGHGAQVQDIIMAQDWRDYIGVLGLAGSVLVLCEEQRNEAQRPPREPALFPAKRPNHLLKRSHDIIKGISDAGRISSIPAYQKRRYYEAPYDNNALRIGSFLVSPAGVHIDIRMPDLVAPNTQTTVRIGPRTNTTVRIGPHTNTTIEISPHTDKIVQIAWKPPRAYNESGTFWPMDFYSTLPYGWVPEGSIHLFCLFLDHLKQMWLELCKKWHSIVSGTRKNQFRERGQSSSLVGDLARLAGDLADMRDHHATQLTVAEDFLQEYTLYFGKPRTKVDGSLQGLREVITKEFDRFDQLVRDMLQLEFAWVSVFEAHRSTSLATSMKRLSWITFIFLPALFSASLFGMNVNILENNPDWRWYLLAAGASLTVTVVGWLTFKYTKMERLVEEHVGNRIERQIERISGSRNSRRGSDPENTSANGGRGSAELGGV